MPQFVKVASLGEIRGNHGVKTHIRGLDIAIFRCGTELFAVNNVCAHQHFSMLHQGLVENCNVTCPMHGWIYDLRTGKATTGEGRIARYPLMVEGADILVELPEEAA